MTDSSLDLLLKGRSDEFKDRVRALVQQYDIDENDPTFILLTGTTTLEVMLEKHPQEFEALFKQLLAQMDQRWGALQQQWATAAQESSTAAQQLTQALTDIKQASEAQQQTIRTQAGSQAELLTTVYQEQVQQLKAETEQLAAHATASAQATAAEQVKDISKGLRQAYYLEAAGFACLGAKDCVRLTIWKRLALPAWVQLYCLPQDGPSAGLDMASEIANRPGPTLSAGTRKNCRLAWKQDLRPVTFILRCLRRKK